MAKNIKFVKTFQISPPTQGSLPNNVDNEPCITTPSMTTIKMSQASETICEKTKVLRFFDIDFKLFPIIAIATAMVVLNWCLSQLFDEVNDWRNFKWL